MPNFMTHCLFGEQVLDAIMATSLKETIQKYKNVYNLGTQGPDIFFYNPICHILKGVHNVGVYMHEHQTEDFFKNGFSIIKKMVQTQEKEICTAYLTGCITHFYLDSRTHPYIYWYTDQLQKNSSLLPFRLHSGIETNIDGVYLKKYKKLKPGNFSQSKWIALESTVKNIVAAFLSDTLKVTYGAKGNGIIFSPGFIKASITGIQTGRALFKDRTGLIKHGILKIEQHFKPLQVIGGMFITNRQEALGDFLNLKHTLWYNLWDEQRISTASFPELFSNAVHSCAGVLSELSAYKDNHHLSEVHIDNYSYHSGLPLVS